MAAAQSAQGYRHVACAVESPDRSAPALAEAERIAALSGARLSVVHVAASPTGFTGGRTSGSAPVEEIRAELQAVALGWLAPVAGRHGGDPVVLHGDAPAQAFAHWCRGQGVDLIVVSPHRRGLARLLGSFAGGLVHDAPCPVLLAAAD